MSRPFSPPPIAALPARRRQRLASFAAALVGAAVFWTPPLALQTCLAPGERFHLAILLFALLVPAALVATWRAWFDAPTRADRLTRWIRLALLGPYAGAVVVGAATFFASGEFDRYRSGSTTPAASGMLLPVALATVRAGEMLLDYRMFGAFAGILVVTLFIPRGAFRSVE